MTKPKAQYQGQVVIERDGDEFLVMTPDGAVTLALTRKEAERKARAWFRQHADDDKVNVGKIEWR